MTHEAESMIERVARAMAKADGLDPDYCVMGEGGISTAGVSFSRCYMVRWQNYAAKARAAIEAMREPTEAMEHAGFEAYLDAEAPHEAGPVYQAMIDAALATEGGGE
jgi:hypothetical protein